MQKFNPNGFSSLSNEELLNVNGGNFTSTVKIIIAKIRGVWARFKKKYNIHTSKKTNKNGDTYYGIRGSR